MRLTVLSPARFALIAVSLLTALAAAGCGIKPQKLDPPASVTKDTFPKTYPDPKNDPQPEGIK